MLRVDQGKYEEGIAQYERALAADPKLAIVHFLVAEAMLKQPAADTQQINARLRRAIELDRADGAELVAWPADRARLDPALDVLRARPEPA